ncbi:MAG: transporter [Synoicihabitans sp.]
MNSTQPISLQRSLALLGGVVAASILPLFATAQPTTSSSVVQKLEGGLSYSRGDYGLGTDTEVIVAPFNYVSESGPWSLRATLPWMYLKGPAAVVGGSSGAVGGPSRPNNASSSGLGDSLLALTYKTNPDPVGANINFTGKIKLPTGDENRGLGTGEFDYQAQIDYFESFDGTTPFLTGGYRVLGDGIYQLDDGFYASAGVAFLVADGTSVGGSLDWREAIVPGGDDALESTFFAYRQLSKDWSTTVYGQTGFTDASPDFGLGFSLTFEF